MKFFKKFKKNEAENEALDFKEVEGEFAAEDFDGPIEAEIVEITDDQPQDEVDELEFDTEPNDVAEDEDVFEDDNEEDESSSNEFDSDDFEEEIEYRGSHAHPNIIKSDDADVTAALSSLGFAQDATAIMQPVQVQESVGEHVKPKKNGKKIFLIILFTIIGLIIAAYVGLSIFFMSHFGINSKINDVDVSWKSVAAVESDLAKNAESYTLSIAERNDVTEQIAGTDISFAYESTGEVQSLLDAQNSFCWPTRLVKLLLHKDFGDYSIEYSYDADALSDVIEDLDCDTPSTFEAPEDAYPEFNGTEYVVVAENLGTTVDTEALIPVIEDKVLHGEASMNLDDEGLYVAPEVTSDSEDLAKQIETYNKYVPFALTYQIGDDTYVLDGKEIFEWMTIADDGTYTVDEDEVASWVAKFAKKYDTVGATREFTSIGNDKTYTVSGGTYGWKIDQDKEVEAILNMIDSKKSESREPYYSSEAESHGATDWGDDYIEVNISTQHMYLIRDGKVTLSCDVVTGAPTNGHSTPTGVYSILEMKRNKTLRGDVTGHDEDGSPVYAYETPVSYWARVTWTGVGFHDATWQAAFGGNRYRNGYGSHGCINMSMSTVAELYSNIYVGIPVVIHY